MKNVFAVAAGALVIAVGMTSIGPDARAAIIEVSQESAAGVGDFDTNVLGLIDPFNTGLTAAGFYRYGNPNLASYNGEMNGGPNPVSDLSQVFLVNASDGLSLFVVHDRANDGTGASTRTQWNLTGDTGAFVLVDDPGEGAIVSLGGTQFNSAKNWTACCTDGYVIGALDGNWALFGQFTHSPTGISDWAAVSSDMTQTALALDVGRRVRLRPVAVPEPGTLGLFLFGLAALAWVARRPVTAGARTARRSV